MGKISDKFDSIQDQAEYKKLKPEQKAQMDKVEGMIKDIVDRTQKTAEASGYIKGLGDAVQMLKDADELSDKGSTILGKIMAEKLIALLSQDS